MNKFIFLLCLIVCCAGAAFAAQPVEANLDMHKGDWIGTYIATDDGSAILSVDNAATRHSHVVKVTATGVSTVADVDGITINHMVPLENGKYEIGGGTGADYVKRLVTFTNGAAQTLWDSSRLPQRDVAVSISADGARWVAMKGVSRDMIELQFGETSSYNPSLSIRLGGPSAVPAKATRFLADSEGVRYLRRNPDAVAVVWRGMAYVVQPGGSEPMTALFSTGEGAGRLRWDAATDTLWVEGATGWFAFDGATTLEKTEKHAFKKPKKEVHDTLANGQNADLFTLKSGGYAVAFETMGKHSLRVERTGRAASQKNLPQLNSRSSVLHVSPSGNTVVMLPSGVNGGRVIVAQN
jgi:hypothetical protein